MPTRMPQSGLPWPLTLILVHPTVLLLVCQAWLRFWCTDCTLSSKFSPCLFFFSAPLFFFYISMPSHKAGPGKLDYHSNSIFQILSSYGRLGAEQRHYHLKSAGSPITALGRYAGQPGMLCITDGWPYWLRLSYLCSSPNCERSLNTDNMEFPEQSSIK